MTMISLLLSYRKAIAEYEEMLNQLLQSQDFRAHTLYVKVLALQQQERGKAKLVQDIMSTKLHQEIQKAHAAYNVRYYTRIFEQF